MGRGLEGAALLELLVQGVPTQPFDNPDTLV
jgi:hypothetical protein